jgi:hypothetical protein
VLIQSLNLENTVRETAPVPEDRNVPAVDGMVVEAVTADAAFP